MTELSGRELDRAVAEAKGLGSAVSDMWREPVPYYSSDWAASGPLLEEMRGTLISIEDGSWACIDDQAYDKTGWFEVDIEYAFLGQTGPGAIARAYLAWKGGR